jgi:hypothetical protein
VLIRLNHKPVIDNLRNYPREIVERLATVLCDGAVAKADPRRSGFYDVSDGERTFFIHISPVTGHVWLLASWLAQPAPAAAGYAPQLMERAAGMAHLY